MLLSPRRHSTLADLLRLLAVWMVWTLLWQGLAAVQLRAAGPAHRHHAERADGLFAHRHHHGESARHFHAAGDATVSIAAAAATEEGLDAATAALILAFALLALAPAMRPGAALGRVWRATGVGLQRSRNVEPLLKPPRTA